MSLLDPSPGEVIDRITIIGLKLGFTKDQDLERTLTAERDMLFQRQDLTHIPLGSKVFMLWHELDGVNSRIWQQEDEIRGLQGQWTEAAYAEAGKLALSTRRLADTRHRLIRRIDRELGVVRPNEKLWMKEEEEETKA